MALTNSTTLATFDRNIGYDRIEHEYRAELDGRLIGFYPTYLAAETALNRVAYDILQDTAIVTADNEADAAAATSDEPSPLVDPDTRDAQPTGWCYVCGSAAWNWNDSGPLCPSHFNVWSEWRAEQSSGEAARHYWCAVDGCSYAPRHMHGDTPLCCGHYTETGGVCSCDETPVDPTPAHAPDQPSCELCGAALAEWRVFETNSIHFDVCEACYISEYRDNEGNWCAWWADEIRPASIIAPIDPPTPDPSPSGDPWPDSFFRDATPAEIARFSVTLRDHQARAKMYLCGERRPIVCDALLAEADQALAAGPCLACGKAHFIQSCPEIYALLMAPDASTVAQGYVDRFLAEVA